MRRIGSRQNPIVARYRTAARGDTDGVMLLDGPHLVADALAAGVHLREAAVAVDSQTPPDMQRMLEQLDGIGVDLYGVTAPVMAALSPVRSPSRIVALADRPVRYDRVFASPAPLVVVALDVQDPGNVGAIVRVAEAAGATGAMVAGTSADPFGWKAIRGSMGSALRLPLIVERTRNWTSEVRQRGCRIVATVPRGGRTLYDADLRGPLAILIGGEGSGLPGDLLEQADQRVTVPMQAPVESLNAAVTAALVLYEARRQRAA
jgi:RNA methyltransferase, TrmH family